MILSIIILSFNTNHLTVSCVSSLVTHYKKQLENGIFEIIVFDNNSQDDSVALLKKDFATQKGVRIVSHDKNEGFTRGNNVAAKLAKGKYLLFLNSDTEVKDQGILSMVAFFEGHKDAGIVGGKLVNQDGTIQSSAGKFYTMLNAFFMLLGIERLGILRTAPQKISRVDWVSGACMMVRSDIFKKLKGFDEKIFMYVEDMELCYRAMKNHFATYYFTQVTIVHKEQGSSNRSFAILNIYKGLLYFYEKHRPSWEYAIIRFSLRMKASISIAIGILTNNTYLRTTYTKALHI